MPRVAYSSRRAIFPLRAGLISAGNTKERQIENCEEALTDDSCSAYRPGFAGVPAGSAGRAPPACRSLSKEEVLQGASLAGAEERGHQLLLPLHALSVGQRGSRSHRVDAGHRGDGSTRRPAHLQHRSLKQGIQIGCRGTFKAANAAVIKGFPWNRNTQKSS